VELYVHFIRGVKAGLAYQADPSRKGRGQVVIFNPPVHFDPVRLARQIDGSTVP